MNTQSPGVRMKAFRIFALCAMGLSVLAFGCGPSEESLEDDWETTPTVSPTAQLEYRIDSLQNEGRRMNDQVDALAAENRSLRARIAELETSLSEATTAPPTPPPVAIPAGDMRAGYSTALDQFMSRNYEGAIQQFEGLLSAGIGEDLADNCHYWVGESYYALGRYNEAISRFETVLSYPTSGKKPYAQLMIGNSYAALGNSSSARDAYNAVVSSYPASSLVGKAQQKLARLP
jgi:tol-pal system protein YbgF